MRSRINRSILATGILLMGIALMHFSLTALQEPGPLETHFANLAKRVVISRASRHGSPSPPANTKASVEAGGRQYGLECTICHGVGGRAQTPSGHWMYPRAADLTSKASAGLLRPGAVLDHQQRHQVHGNAADSLESHAAK